MANYNVDPDLLTPYLPAHTELDTWNGKTYVSLVGFMFLNTCVLGVKVPFHANFPEVNLRFYVRYKGEEGRYKRGVVFIREIVPKPALTFVANYLFGERYKTLPMRKKWAINGTEMHIGYAWKSRQWNILEVNAAPVSHSLQTGSEEEFITEHYWGYSSIGINKTGEYKVEHPAWEIYPVKSYNIQADFSGLYGKEFESLQATEPASVLLAEGSSISVFRKKNLFVQNKILQK